jgi:hypothetical protein
MQRNWSRLRPLVFACSVFLFVGCSKDDEQDDEPVTPGIDARIHELDVIIAPETNDASTNVSWDVGSRDGFLADVSMDSSMDAAHMMRDAVTMDMFDEPGDTRVSTLDVGLGTVDSLAGRPMGQCRIDTDCPEGPNGQLCSRLLPGGACIGCGTDEHCPNRTRCQFGTCIAECEETNDCAPGLRCLNSGRCAAMPCADGRCPVDLFTCDSSQRCTRSTCREQTDCSERTICLQGICIEQRIMR